MEIVFKVTASSPSTPPQLGDTNFLAHYTGANRSMAWAEVAPGVRQATEKFVLPYIGTAFYDDLVGKFHANDILTAEQAKALELMQDCIAYYTAYHILPERNAFISTVGVTQNTPTESSASPTSQWAWKAKRWNALENADTFLDKLLAYLEQQVAAEVAYFDLWKDSAAYNVRKSDFFRSTAELDEFLNIQGSRRSYVSLVKYMREVEEDVILPLLCTEQYNALLESDLDADALALKAKVSKAVAYLGLNAAIPHHRIVIDGDGFRVVSQTDQYDDRRNQASNIHEAAIIALATTAEQRGRRYLFDLENFLRQNADTYILWRDSVCNNSPTQRGHSVVISPDRVGGVALF